MSSKFEDRAALSSGVGGVVFVPCNKATHVLAAVDRPRHFAPVPIFGSQGPRLPETLRFAVVKGIIMGLIGDATKVRFCMSLSFYRI